MPNNQQLPQPNLPKGKQKKKQSTSNQPQTSQPNANQNQPGKETNQIKGNPNQVPAGLDPNNPGGSPPPLDDQGRVQGKAANISNKMQKKRYGDANRAKTEIGSTEVNQSKNSQDKTNNQQPKPPLQGPPSSSPKKQAKPSGPTPPKAQPNLKKPNKKQQPTQQPKKANINKVQGKQTTVAGNKPPGQPPQGPQPTLRGKNSNNQPIFAQAKNSPLKFLPFVLGGLAVVGVVIFLFTKVLGGGSPSTDSDQPAAPSQDNSSGGTSSNKEVVLTYWGLWEPGSVFEDVLKDFESQNPGVTVDYRKKSHKDYRSRLQTAIASGNGPDIFRYHATWTPMLTQELAAMPSKVMSPNKYEQTFYPIMAKQLQADGQIVGIPLMYDGLALYYNKDILKTANEEPPATWGGLKLLASKLTVKDEGVIERGGLAIGNTTNVQHWSDILGLLIYQNGGDPADPVSSEVRDAIKFFASFGQDSPVFSTSLPSSTVAFAREEVAMIFAPSWRVHEIKDMNPDLNFGTAPVPKLSEQEYGWATYWAEGVSSKSKNKEEAWALLKYLSSEKVMKQLYSEQSQMRAFGEIYPREDMADTLDNDLVTAYLLDAPKAQSWYLCSFTHDDGLNDKMIDYYKDATQAVIEGGRAQDVLQTLDKGVKQVLRQYNAD
jgi:multiple sugar transport system substrate-binding protein